MTQEEIYSALYLDIEDESATRAKLLEAFGEEAVAKAEQVAKDNEAENTLKYAIAILAEQETNGEINFSNPLSKFVESTLQKYPFFSTDLLTYSVRRFVDTVRERKSELSGIVNDYIEDVYLEPYKSTLEAAQSDIDIIEIDYTNEQLPAASGVVFLGYFIYFASTSRSATIKIQYGKNEDFYISFKAFKDSIAGGELPNSVTIIFSSAAQLREIIGYIVPLQSLRVEENKLLSIRGDICRSIPFLDDFGQEHWDTLEEPATRMLEALQEMITGSLRTEEFPYHNSKLDLILPIDPPFDGGDEEGVEIEVEEYLSEIEKYAKEYADKYDDKEYDRRSPWDFIENECNISGHFYYQRRRIAHAGTNKQFFGSQATSNSKGCDVSLDFKITTIEPTYIQSFTDDNAEIVKFYKELYFDLYEIEEDELLSEVQKLRDAGYKFARVHLEGLNLWNTLDITPGLYWSPVKRNRAALPVLDGKNALSYSEALDWISQFERYERAQKNYILQPRLTAIKTAIEGRLLVTRETIQKKYKGNSEEDAFVSFLDSERDAIGFISAALGIQLTAEKRSEIEQYIRWRKYYDRNQASSVAKLREAQMQIAEDENQTRREARSYFEQRIAEAENVSNQIKIIGISQEILNQQMISQIPITVTAVEEVDDV